MDSKNSVKRMIAICRIVFSCEISDGCTLKQEKIIKNIHINLMHCIRKSFKGAAMYHRFRKWQSGEGSSIEGKVLLVSFGVATSLKTNYLTHSELYWN